MANPKFRTGPLTVKAGAPVDKFRLVKFNSDGKVVHAGASDKPHGVVTEKGQPAVDPGVNDLALAYPEDIALHIGGVPQIATDATDLKVGSAVYAAADGKVAASGTVYVGWVEKAPANGRVPVVLQLPGQAG